MESKSTSIFGLPSIRQRISQPDVPEDVAVALLHLNDPNWDLHSRADTESLSDTVNISDKSQSQYGVSTLEMHRSTTAASEYDTESHSESKRAHMRSISTLEYEEESPYAEVRAAVSNTDDPNMPVSTFRMWFLGAIFAILMSGINQFTAMRYPAVYITGLVFNLLALPCGKLLERILPTTRFNVFGYTFSFNPGPFNIKEHTMITVMASVVQNGAYATDVIAAQQIYFNQYWGFGYQICLCLSSQVIGFAFAGAARKFLVWPASMIWPSALVNAALFSALHKNYGRREGGHMSRERFFLVAFLCSFVWYWLPGYLFTALSVFNWVCWIAPNNIVVNQLFGYSTGLGMGFITFDWAQISFIGSPLVVPWWAQVNTFASFVFFFWIVTPILYYKNVFYAKYLPMTSTRSFDNTGKRYDTHAVIQNGDFQPDLYRAYSPVYISVTFALYYAISFASMTAVVVHTWLWYSRDIKLQFRTSLKENRDVHSRLMSVYPEVPVLWYGILGVLALVLGIVTVTVWDTRLPVWCLFLSLLIGAIFVVPIGIVRAITNQTIALQIFAEMVIGYIYPGRPVAMMIFKTFGFISMSQALSFSNDLKLGHYMKIPPRIMFLGQVVATAISVVVVVFVQSWMFHNIPDICSPDQKDHFVCPGTSVFATAALVWGGVGPARLFGKDSTYQPLLYFFLIGAILPFPFYYLARRYPLSAWRFVNIPVVFAGISLIPPATGINFSSWFMVGAFFQFFMRRYHYRWWNRYNYILSAALDAGVAIALIVIFLTLQVRRDIVELNWWGNTVWQNTADAQGARYATLEEGQTFGPTTWS